MTGLSPPLEERPRVVIIGGGFGGLRVAEGLRRARARVTVIDRTNHHLFQPLLYQVATGVLSPGQIAPPLRSLFRRQDNIEVVLGNAETIDLEQRVVRVQAERELEIPYDQLVVAAGATHSYFGHDEWEPAAPGMKTLADAIRLRSRILAAFEFADQEPDASEREAWMTFAIVGAGPTGVELAGQIAILARRVLRGEYHNIDPSRARVVLLDAVPRVLGSFPERLSQRARRDLTRLGVDVRVGCPVVEIDDGGVVLDDGNRTVIRARTTIWAAGVMASPLAAALAEASGAALERDGRLRPNRDLTLPGHPEVFVIGDMVSLPGVPGTAQPALQEGKYVSSVIRARLAGGAGPARFRYRDLGTMAIIGRTSAVANVFGRVGVGGFPAFLMWGVVHLAYLVGWGNRYEAVARWLWTILARNRRERLISMRDVGDPAPVDRRRSSSGPERL